MSVFLMEQTNENSPKAFQNLIEITYKKTNKIELLHVSNFNIKFF